MAKSKKETGRLSYMRHIFNGLSQNVALLQKRLKELEKKEKFLRGEALKHQAQLMSDFEEKSILKSKRDPLHLKEEHLQVLKHQLSGQRTVSALFVTSSKVSVEVVEGMDEDEEEEDESSQGPAELGLLKRWNVEGKIGECSVSLQFLAKYDMENPLGRITTVEKLQTAEGNPVIEKIINHEQDGPFRVQQLTNLLFGLQILYEERSEAVDILKDVPNIEIQDVMEPYTIQFSPEADYDIKIVWNIKFDGKNMRVKNSIYIECEDEVTARFSKSQGFPYLSGRKSLHTPKEVIQFVESFMDQ